MKPKAFNLKLKLKKLRIVTVEILSMLQPGLIQDPTTMNATIPHLNHNSAHGQKKSILQNVRVLNKSVAKE